MKEKFEEAPLNLENNRRALQHKNEVGQDLLENKGKVDDD